MSGLRERMQDWEVFPVEENGKTEASAVNGVLAVIDRLGNKHDRLGRFAKKSLPKLSLSNMAIGVKVRRRSDGKTGTIEHTMDRKAFIRFDDGSVGWYPSADFGGFDVVETPKKKPEQPNLPGMTPEEKSLDEKLRTMELQHWEQLGGGTSNTYKAELEDGTPVMVKGRLHWGGIRENLDETRGIEHAQGAQRIADYLGVKTPRVTIRPLASLGGVDIEGGYDEEDLGFDPNDEVQVQEFMDDFGPLSRWDIVSKEQAERFALLDAVIGNTDRHDGNIGMTPDGEPVAIDMDLTFPQGTEEVWGNAIRWTDEWASEDVDIGEEPPPEALLVGSELSPENYQKIVDMIGNKEKWDKQLSGDGITPEELEAMWDRIYEINDTGTVPSPPVYTSNEPDWTHYYEASA